MTGTYTVALSQAPACNQTSYNAAFPGAASDMGCPDGPDSGQTPDACGGYELMQDLDFDTDGDGSTYTFSGSNPVSDSGDAYHNSGSGWDPIGPAATPNSSRRRTPDVRGAYTRNCAGRRRTKIRLER